MQKLAINDQLGSCTWQEIYVVFRVYGLNSGKIGVKIYVDPEAARKDGRLQFEPADERWKVTPGKPQPQAEAQAQVTVQSQSVTTTTTTGRNSWRLSSHGVSTCAQPPVSGLRLMEI